MLQLTRVSPGSNPRAHLFWVSSFTFCAICPPGRPGFGPRPGYGPGARKCAKSSFFLSIAVILSPVVAQGDTLLNLRQDRLLLPQFPCLRVKPRHYTAFFVSGGFCKPSPQLITLVISCCTPSHFHRATCEVGPVLRFSLDLGVKRPVHASGI